MVRPEPFKILYEDDAVLVVYKSAGLATESRDLTRPDLVSLLKSRLKRTRGDAYLAVVHRLDQPVEGLLVFGLTKQAGAELSKQLDGSLGKRYLAVVAGVPRPAAGTLRDTMVFQKGKPAQNAVLKYEMLWTSEEDHADSKTVMSSESMILPAFARLARRAAAIQGDAGTPVSVVQVELQTGRFHQIRMQMAKAGCPLLGDRLHADAATQDLSRQLGVRNVALCCHELWFRHPVTGENMKFHL